LSNIIVPDAMAESVEQFVLFLGRTNAHTRKLGEIFDKELSWVEQEKKSLASQSVDPLSEFSLTDKVRVLLQATGEAFQSPEGLEVSSRVQTWMLSALARQEGISVSEAQLILESKTDGDRFWFFMQLLDDPALNALIKILEDERER
jgi:hypothetical protein